MTEEKEVWTFHSSAKNEIVYDPIKKGEIATFKDHQIITDDPELAKQLKKRGYDEMVLYSEDDEVQLDTGLRVRLGDLPDGLKKEFIGKPKRAAQSLIERITPFKGKEEDPPPPPEEDDEEPDPTKKHVCPICKRDDFTSSSALNGHFAHCKKEDDAEV